MLEYYINTKKHTIKFKITLETRCLLLLNNIMFIKNIKNNQKQTHKNPTIGPELSIRPLLHLNNKTNTTETQILQLFNKLTMFLIKKIPHKQKSLKIFIDLAFSKRLPETKIKKHKNMHKKINYTFWKNLKKKYKYVLYKHPVNYLNKYKFLNFLKKKLIFRYAYNNNKFKSKQQYKNYNLKNKVRNHIVKTKYNNWSNKNYKNYFYVTNIKKNFFSKKIFKLNQLVKWFFLNKFKKQFKKLIKKKKDYKNPTKTRISHCSLLQIQQTKHIKINLIQTKAQKCFIIINKQKTKLNLKKNKTKAIDIKNFTITPKTTIYYIKKQIKKHTNIKNVNTKKQLKNLFFNSCFNATQENLYNLNKNPNLLLSFMPQLIINTIYNLKQKKHNNNNLINTVLEQQQQNTQKYKNTAAIDTIFKKSTNLNIINNYLPIYFFKNNNTINNFLTTQLYYNNINITFKSKYKTLFIFFVLNFLEIFLLKKIWVRINTSDPTNSFWKNHINLFLYNNLFLYKKFNKLIPIRELLEILWLTFKNHDLQILLFFIKRKLENAHFKKHKKILSIFFDILKKNEFIFNLLKIKGFFFDIRGKVGVSGNAKKRHHSFSIGKISNTSQNVGSYFQQISVWTPTGQMGITCLLQY